VAVFDPLVVNANPGVFTTTNYKAKSEKGDGKDKAKQEDAASGH
jgi:hypothetical protein